MGMTDAKGRLAELEEDRIGRIGALEDAKGRLADYRESMGVLAVDGKATDEIATELARLRDAVEIETAVVAIMDEAITSAKAAVLDERLEEVKLLARDAAAERDAHRAELQKILESMMELEESRNMIIQPTGQRPEPRSLILDRKASHWAQQVQRMASGLPEAPMIFQDD